MIGGHETNTPRISGVILEEVLKCGSGRIELISFTPAP